MFVIRYRWQIIIITILLVAAGLIPLSQIRINPDLESYLPNSMPSRQSNKIITDAFGNEELLLIVFETEDVLNNETLKRIGELSNRFSQMPEFKRVYSLFQAKNIRSEDGSMVVDPVIGRLPETAAGREMLRRSITKNDLAYKIVVSDDFRYTQILLSSSKIMPDKELMELVQSTINSCPGKERVCITGQPYLRDESNRKIGHDMMLLLPIGLLLMFLFLLVSFREIRGVLLPISVVIFSILICLGMIPLFGWQLSLIGVLIPIMMIAIANNYGVYFVARYQDINAAEPGLGVTRIVQKTTRYLITPVTLCGLTTIAGILGLVAHLLKPARQMGIITGIGIAFALLVSLFFIPAVMSLLKKGKPHKDLSGNSQGPIPKLITRTGEIITAIPGHIVILFSLFMIICASGLIVLKVAPDSNKVLPATHPFNRANSIIDNHFGGSKLITVMFEGDATDPALLRRIDLYGQKLKMLPNVGSITSLPVIIRKISKVLNDSSEAGYDKIPDTREAVSQYLELYSMSGNPADMEQLVNFDYTKTLLSIQFRAKNLKEINNIIDKLNEISCADSLHPVIGGFSLTDKELSDSVKNGQYLSLIVAFIAIILLLSLIFRSIKAGLIGSLPLLFAVLCTFGLMGWLGIDLDLVTALLSSISIGLGVDFTIHIFWRIKWELERGNNYRDSIIITLKTIGRGIIINAFSVMLGFSVLFLSGFPLIRSFAFLIIISLFLCLISALIFIPALIYLTKPGFLSPKANNNIRVN